MSVESPVVVGIDVGEPQNGFYLVALKDNEVVKTLNSSSPTELLQTCNQLGAVAIAIDCPCKWRKPNSSVRKSESDLRNHGIKSFYTPTKEIAPTNAFYNWILCGEILYQEILSNYKLFDGGSGGEGICFETFPHAIVWGLNGELVTKKDRPEFIKTYLRKANIIGLQLTNKDYRDALLCAVTAKYFLSGDIHIFGDQETGHIVVPKPRKHNIRRATPADAEAVAEIVNHSILTSTANFHLEPLSVESQREFIQSATECHPVLVCELNNEVVGWASLKPYSPRAAYSQTVESSVYIHPDHHRKGIGSALMEEIIRQAKAQNHHSIIAGATAEQTASIKLHESLGFKKVAHYKEMGFKFGRWLDTVYLQLMLD